MRVFSLNVADVTGFQTFFLFPRTSLSNPFQPKSLFHSNPIIFKQISAKSFQGMHFLHFSHLLDSDYVEFMLKVLKIGLGFLFQ